MGTNVLSNANNFHCPAIQYGCRAKPLYIAKMWFACLIFRVMAHVKFSDWMPLNAILWLFITLWRKWFPKVNFFKFGFILPHYWVYLSPEGVVLNPEGFVLSREGFVLPHFWDYLPPEGVVLLPDGNWRNAIWTVLPCALNVMMQSSICCQANHIRHSKIGRFLYKYKLEKYIHNCA